MLLSEGGIRDLRRSIIRTDFDCNPGVAGRTEESILESLTFGEWEFDIARIPISFLFV
jgi:hypothetical protein